jgi:hypothetical protein
MPRSSSVIGDEIASRARGLDLFLQRTERLHRERRLSRGDVERAYSGGFLEFYAYAERSLERLFLGLLRGRLTSPHRGVRPLIMVNSDVIASAIVTGDRAYADWLPYGRYTAKRAEAYFSGGRPFSLLDKVDLGAFERAGVVRNALAHQSGSANRIFEDKMVIGKSLPPDQRRPAGYLRGIHTIGQTRMNFMLSDVSLAFRKLCG